MLASGKANGRHFCGAHLRTPSGRGGLIVGTFDFTTLLATSVVVVPLHSRREGGRAGRNGPPEGRVGVKEAMSFKSSPLDEMVGIRFPISTRGRLVKAPESVDVLDANPRNDSSFVSRRSRLPDVFTLFC
ncbi:unnamed protein product [Protopolystoma xenopodis]|uniref:Uncharacterized protein n=1 Tax=Protopolystoma xenopodis TaxID=117903 RepID=A0A448XF64_9PLAT|nr:unnamed protein product [Protopolystoma xenopodis]